MRIAILNWPNSVVNIMSPGGLEQVQKYEAEELIRRGIQVDWYARQFDCDLGYTHRLRHFGTLGAQDPLYYLDFLWRGRRADIVQAMNTPLMGAIHPGRTLVYFQNRGWLPAVTYVRERYRQTHFAFNSHYVRHDFLYRFPFIAEERCFVVHNAVDEMLFQPRQQWRPRQRKELLFSSQWDERKGIFTLIEAVRILRARRDDFELLLAGSPYLWDSGHRTEQQLQTERRVMQASQEVGGIRVVGRLPHNKLAELMRQVDIFVTPSEWAEPFGLVNVEAMATGIPVIASAVGGIPEVVEHERTGLLVPPGNPGVLAEAINRLLDAPELCRQMGDAGRQRVLRYFTWTKHVDRLLEVYDVMRQA